MSKLLIAEGGYLPKRYFTFRDYELMYKIQTSYPESEWAWARSHVSENKKISQSAIALAERVKNELGIEVFPLISTVAIKGYRDSGQCKFKMYGKEQYNACYFDYPAKCYKSKKGKLSVWDHSNEPIITITTIPQPHKRR